LWGFSRRANLYNEIIKDEFGEIKTKRTPRIQIEMERSPGRHEGNRYAQEELFYRLRDRRGIGSPNIASDLNHISDRRQVPLSFAKEKGKIQTEQTDRVTFLTCILEKTGLNFGRVTSYPL
jgi:hypothetical protein